MKFNPLLLVPGLLCWVLIGVGAATGNRTWIGLGTILTILSIVVGLVATARRSSAKRAEAGRIWAGGMRGRAKVVDISTKGGRVNDNPTIDFELDVTPEGQSTYRAQVSVLVSLLAIPRIQPGCEIEVRIDPQDRSKVVVDEKLTYLGYKSGTRV
ncbi:hypothetical protein LVJ94_48350 [Pendulispora rubella]|uniref:DUF58 domain-containing protein n=1 Tax=Pendulispora rubella TaxID=2741070 RepID=A0ABZ2L541_9BACT